MIKYCPIISYQERYSDERNCMEEICALWDEEKEQCCLKSAALAIAGKKSGGSSNLSLQAGYINPVYTGSNPYDNPYAITCQSNVLDFDEGGYK